MYLPPSLSNFLLLVRYLIGGVQRRRAPRPLRGANNAGREMPVGLAPRRFPIFYSNCDIALNRIFRIEYLFYNIKSFISYTISESYILL